MNLNEFQRRAVYYKDGPVLVLAGPGSGKTTVITERIRYLIKENGCNPQKILVLTFTKAAAKHMESRFCECSNEKLYLPHFMTIHALCYEIIRRERNVARLEIKNNKDLDDLIEQAYEILKNPDALKRWQNKFDCILVDEFQDTSLKQAKVIFMLALVHRNIMIVGDDDQSIYSFRGAVPDIFTVFREWFSTSETIQLKMNYRSKASIMKTAESLIRHNEQRLEKDAMYCVNADAEKTRGIELITYENRKQQMLSMIQQIQTLSETIAYKDIAVLFRTRAQFLLFLIYSRSYALPVYCPERMEYNRIFVWDDIYSYLKIINGEGCRADYIRIMNKPQRYLDRNYLNREEVNERAWLSAVKRNDREQGKRLALFLDEIDKMRQLPPYLCVYHLLYQMGYMEFLKKVAFDINAEEEELIEIAEGILQYAKNAKKISDVYHFLRRDDYQDKAGINVLTMHGAKGLEFAAVFVPDLNEGVLPNKKAAQSSDIEEERRLLYVALTRGKEKVYLSFVSKKNGKALKASPFIEELVI